MIFVVLSTTTELLSTTVLGSINFPHVNGMMAIFKYSKCKNYFDDKDRDKYFPLPDSEGQLIS